MDGGFAHRVLLGSCSHHLSAERQFRYPVEQGVQRSATAQWTTTAVCFSSRGTGGGATCEYGDCRESGGYGHFRCKQHGSGHGPAAADTILTHFQDTETNPDSYDVIVTGDLGSVGQAALVELLKQRGFDLGEKLQDCGILIYDTCEQDMHAGGSGCGCAAAVFLQGCSCENSGKSSIKIYSLLLPVP